MPVTKLYYGFAFSIKEVCEMCHIDIKTFHSQKYDGCELLKTYYVGITELKGLGKTWDIVKYTPYSVNVFIVGSLVKSMTLRFGIHEMPSTRKARKQFRRICRRYGIKDRPRLIIASERDW